MTIFPICAFKDNYIWSWVDKGSQKLWVVDPGDSAPVIATLKKLSLGLGGILLTHHHHDHSGGITNLIQSWPDVSVIGSTSSAISSLTQRVNEKDILDCGGLWLQVLPIPGHTLDHTAFFNEKILFCGDTLFSAGCGRVFEGTYEQMFESLQKLSRLAPHTLLYCGHEYTEANLRFALAVEPHNLLIQRKLDHIQAVRRLNKSSLPTPLEDEFGYNPFFRCAEPEVIKAVENHAQKSLASPLEVFIALREWKNGFTF